jgi:hypothetical protein
MGGIKWIVGLMPATIRAEPKMHPFPGFGFSPAPICYKDLPEFSIFHRSIGVGVKAAFPSLTGQKAFPPNMVLALPGFFIGPDAQ